MRMCAGHETPGLELFVYGKSGGAFPARQHEQAGRIVARRHGLDPARTLFIEQNPEAIAAGAFHNDVVAVANERVLFTHEQAFADPARLYEDLRSRLPTIVIEEVPASAVSLGEAVSSYLFNAQLATLPSKDPSASLGVTAGRRPSPGRRPRRSPWAARRGAGARAPPRAGQGR